MDFEFEDPDPPAPPPAGAVSHRALTGSEKVATLLLAMGKPLASRLLVHFDPAELKMITRSAAELGSVPVELLEEIVEDFAGEFSNGVHLQGTASQVEQLLTGVLPPEQVVDIMSDVLGSSNRTIWDRLAAVADAILAEYLGREHVQTVALVLSQLNSAVAAKVMALLPREQRSAVTRRLVNMRPVQDQVLRAIESQLNEDLLLKPPRPPGEATSRTADIINKMAPEQIEEILQDLAEARPREAELLRSKLFSFNDIARLRPRDRALIFERVASDRIVMALKNTEQSFREAVLSAMTARSRRIVENELTNGGTSPQREIAAARRGITDLILQMAERKELELNPPADDE